MHSQFHTQMLGRHTILHAENHTFSWLLYIVVWSTEGWNQGIKPCSPLYSSTSQGSTCWLNLTAFLPACNMISPSIEFQSLAVQWDISGEWMPISFVSNQTTIACKYPHGEIQWTLLLQMSLSTWYLIHYKVSSMLFMCSSRLLNCCSVWWTNVDITCGHSCSNVSCFLCVMRVEERRWEQKEEAAARLICCPWREWQERSLHIMLVEMKNKNHSEVLERTASEGSVWML